MIYFQAETKTQMEVGETIKSEIKDIYLRLQFSKMSGLRLIETTEISGI